MTETPRPWDRLDAETSTAYGAFLAYVALGARRSVRGAARQYHSAATASGEIKSVEDTTVRTWMGWSAKHDWVSRAIAREEWILSTSDEQIIINKLACDLAIVTRAHDFLTSGDSEVWLRGVRGYTLQHPPVQRMADVSERIADLSDIPDADIERWGREAKEIREAARKVATIGEAADANQARE